MPSCCWADDPVPVALLTPTVTLVEDSGQPRLASISFSSDSGVAQRHATPLLRRGRKSGEQGEDGQ